MLASSQVGRKQRLRDVVGVLFNRALKVRYRGSVLGILWSALNPLGMALVYMAIFGNTFSKYYGGSDLAYAASVYIGLTIVGFFVGATTQTLPAVVANAGLFVAFPLSTLAAYGFQQVVASLPVIMVVALIETHDVLHVLLLVIPFVALAMFATGVGLFVSAANVFFRDIPHLYELAMFLLWVATPVFYPAAIVPARLLHYLAWNPLFPIVESARALVLTATIPSVLTFATAFGEGALTLVLGALAFRAMRPQFMDLI
jgi:ABC-type polysaccharide/polyol phosphate export permease